MMFDALPDLTPRDSHILWYTSIRNPHLQPSHLDQNHQPDNVNPSQTQPNNAGNQNRPGGRQQGIIPFERTPLGRLRADEAYMSRRLANISNFGSTWLKPPGVAKSLYQMREETREAQEHAEAVRREQLAAELAEVEAAQAAQAAGGLEGGMMDVEGGGGGEGDGEGMGEVNLDDEIPDADDGGLGGFGYDEDSSEEEEEDDDDVDHGENGDDDDDDIGGSNHQHQRAHQRELASRIASMRATEDRLREMMARGGGEEADEGDIYGVTGEDIEEQDPSQILEEEDLVHEHHLQYEVEPGMDLDMDANLDDDIPEAESLGGYEHTDSDAELSSSEDEGLVQNVSFGAGRGGRAPPAAPRYRSSLASNATRNSLDISSILSRDGSSMMGSSPQVRRRN